MEDKKKSESPNLYSLKVYMWIISYLKAYKWQLSLFITLSSVIAFIELSIPKVLQYCIDVIFPEKQLTLFTFVLLGLAVIFSLRFVSIIFRNLLQRTVQEKAARDLQYSLFTQLRKLGFSYYERNPVGETLSLFNTDVSTVQQIYRRYFPEIVERLIMLMITTALIISINVHLFLIIIPCFLSYYLIGPYFEKKTMIWIKEAIKNKNASHKSLYDSISALVELRTFNAQQWDLKKLISALRLFHNSHLTANLFAYLRGTVRRLTVYFGALIFFIYGAKMVEQNVLSVGEFVAFTFYYFRIMWDLTTVVTLTTEQRAIILQADRLYKFIKSTPDVVEHRTPEVLTKIKGELTFNNVYFSYPRNKNVIQGFNFHINPGERIALVGSSGSGKSTILKLIGRFYDPKAGDILLDGVPLKKLSFSQLRENIGYVFQDTYLFGDSVMENIRFGNPEATNEQVSKAAKAAYAHEFIISLPQGYETPLGERGVRLSGGQKQRIAIARMFIKDPSIVLLDEATSALDNVSELGVQKAFDALLKGRTTIAVAHRLSTIRNFDRIVLLDKGRNIEMGSYEELMKKEGHFYRLSQG